MTLLQSIPVHVRSAFTQNTSSDSGLATELIASRAKAVEVAVFNEFGSTTAAYKAKIRSLFVNLKDKNNPGLRESVVNGELPVDKFATMSSKVCYFNSIKTIRLLILY